MGTTIAHNIAALSREWFEAVWNRRDDAAIGRLASSQVLAHGLGEDGQDARGLDQFMRFRSQLLAAFPDMKMRVDDVLVDGNKSAVRITFTGTHQGHGIGTPPTGRKFTATGIVMLTWQHGQIIEAWNEFDAAGMMRQLQTPSAKMRA